MTEANPTKYVQVGYLGKEHDRESELATMVQRALPDQLRVEFEQFAYPDAVCNPNDPPRDQLVNRFVDHLQPSLQQAIDAAQAADDLAWDARENAQDDLKSAEIALSGAKAQSDSTEKFKTVKAADVKSKMKALDAAKRAADAADKTVVKREVALNYQKKLREDFHATISLILDSDVSTEKIATDSVGALCNVLSFYFSGKALGVVGRTRTSPPTSSRRSRQATSSASGLRPRSSRAATSNPGSYGSGVYYGTSGTAWGEQRMMERNYLTEGKDTLDDKVPLADPRRRDELEAFLASGLNVAVSHQDFAHSPVQPAPLPADRQGRPGCVAQHGPHIELLPAPRRPDRLGPCLPGRRGRRDAAVGGRADRGRAGSARAAAAGRRAGSRARGARSLSWDFRIAIERLTSRTDVSSVIVVNEIDLDRSTLRAQARSCTSHRSPG